MPTEGFKRKLTAVFSADVEGYSRLMADDEAATVKTIAMYREVMTLLITQHRGRVVDSPGDNVLAEFASVVDAVQCAVAVQKEFQSRNAALPESRRMQFRIGINLGDVIEEDERLYGDGVNIAARLEALAEPGGICVSKTAFDQIETKLPLGYEYLGEQEVKNIPKPVGAYKVVMEPRVTVAEKIEKKKGPPFRRHKAILTGSVALIVLIIAGVIWNFYFRPSPIEPASEEKMAYPLPDKPSIAVLPFTNMSEDLKQEYFSDGLTEEIITALSKMPRLFVIARNSTFTYKGKPVKVQQVAEELGVRYVLEGSVRKAEDQIRITAQLIDALTGHHVWAERYDRDLKHIFAIQDEITMKICNALQIELTSGEQARLWHKGTKNLEAWGCIVKGNALFARFTKGANAKARDLYERAVTIDSKDAFAWTMLAWTHWIDAFLGYSESRAKSFKLSVEFAKKAQSLDDTISDVYALLGGISLFRRQYDKAIAAGEKSIALGPNSATSHVLFGWTMSYAGRFEEAIALIKKGMRLTPHYPAFYLNHLGRPYFQTGRYEEALATYNQLLERSRKGEFNPLTVHLNLAATYIMLGQEEEARAHAAQALKINPNFSLQWVRKASFWKDPAHLERSLDALRKAGLPETPPLPLPDKPSIAVLPFTNMSDDPKQDYFSDGITEEIITALSKVPDLSVIARNSSFTYKGKSVLIPTVGRELGVHYVLEGSVRKSGDKVRITAQVIDAKTNKHLWAERYDRDLKDIFALQDEITMKILTAVRVKLTEGEQARLYGKGAKNLDSFMKVLEARPYFYRFNRESNIQARQLFEEAITLEPENAHALTMLGWTYLMEVWFGSSEPSSKAVDRVVELAQKALSLDDTIDTPHSLMAHVYLMKRQFEMAIDEAERAVALTPNGADARAHLGMILNYAGKREAAIATLEKAIRLNPIPPNWYLFSLGEAYCLAGEPEKALTAYKQVLHRYPDDIRALIGSTATYSLLGREEEARTQAAQILRMEPKFSLDSFLKTLPFKNKADAELLFDSFHKAGLK